MNLDDRRTAPAERRVGDGLVPRRCRSMARHDRDHRPATPWPPSSPRGRGAGRAARRPPSGSAPAPARRGPAAHRAGPTPRRPGRGGGVVGQPGRAAATPLEAAAVRPTPPVLRVPHHRRRVHHPDLDPRPGPTRPGRTRRHRRLARRHHPHHPRRPGPRGRAGWRAVTAGGTLRLARPGGLPIGDDAPGDPVAALLAAPGDLHPPARDHHARRTRRPHHACTSRPAAAGATG